MLGVCSGCLCTMCASMTYVVCCTWCVHVVVSMCLCMHIYVYICGTMFSVYAGCVCCMYKCCLFVVCVVLCVCVQAFAYVYLMEVSKQESNQFPIQAKETLLM